jgi:competence protein ComEA
MYMKNWLQDRKKWIISSICIFLLCSSVYFYHDQKNEIEHEIPFTQQQMITQKNPDEQAEQEKKADETTHSTVEKRTDVVIDVQGAVVRPGVYTLSSDARVYQAVEMAGGLLPEADEKQVNRAQRLADGMMLYIPRKGEKLPGLPPGASIMAGDGRSSVAVQGEKINLNTATAEQLQTISGIGPSKSAAIIQYREEHGPFKTVEDLTNVSGIGPKTIEKMKDKIFAQ